MRLKLIAPQYAEGREKLKDVFPHMALAYLAGLTPPEWEIVIHNEGQGSVDFDQPADVVGISCYTYLAPRAYLIANEYRRRGIPVVMGGIHPSTMTEEALPHADAVVVGEAELVWREVLDDAKKGTLKRIYRAPHLCDLTHLPTPRFDLFNLSEYLNAFTMFTTRGCPFNCSYCSISLLYGKTYRKRPIEEVIREARFIKEAYMSKSSFPGLFFFIDDNIWIDIEYAKELFRRLIPLTISWISQGSISFCDDRELLELAAKSGCQSIECGFETLHPGNLVEVNKGGVDLSRYAEMVKNLHRVGISVQGTFMVGMTHDEVSSLENIFEFVTDNKIEYPNIFISTPFPGTEYYKRLDNENRILSKDWSKYDFRHLVFKPHKMTPKGFKQAYLELNRKIFSKECIEQRVGNCNHFWMEHVNRGKHKLFYDNDWSEWLNE